jgi:hypothetical protein
VSDNHGNPAVTLKVAYDFLGPALQDKTRNRLTIGVDDSASDEGVRRTKPFIPRANSHKHRTMDEFNELFRNHYQHLDRQAGTRLGAPEALTLCV